MTNVSEAVDVNKSNEVCKYIVLVIITFIK